MSNPLCFNKFSSSFISKINTRTVVAPKFRILLVTRGDNSVCHNDSNCHIVKSYYIEGLRFNVTK